MKAMLLIVNNTHWMWLRMFQFSLGTAGIRMQ